MATIKSFTSLEQSRRLSEILPLESADMCWTNHCYGSIRSSMTISAKSIYEYKKLLERFADSTSIDVFYPAWSLAALLSVLPKIVNNETLFIETSAALWHIGYRNIHTTRAENPVDACVAMIKRLHEQMIYDFNNR